MIESVRQAAEKRSEVVKKKKHIKAVNVKNASKILEAEQQLQQAIKENEEILRSKNVMDFINYHSVQDKFREDVLFPENPNPKFVIGGTLDDQILKLLGSLSFDDIKQYKDADSTNANTSVLSTFQSPQSNLCTIHCTGKDEIWMYGKYPKIYKMDSTGKILRTIDIVFHSNGANALTTDAHGNVFFSNNFEIYQIKDTIENSYMHLYVSNWNIKGLCFASNGDLLASMRTEGLKQSKVTRFSGVMEVQRLQYDTKKRPFFSTHTDGDLFLTTISGGDICVADFAAGAVVAFNDLGELRFRYFGNVSKTGLKRIKPYDIAADGKQNILVADTENNLIHILDRGGNLLRHIKNLSVGGLSINSNGNLVVGDIETGLIKIIKYRD